MDENSKLPEKDFQVKLRKAIETAKAKSEQKEKLNSSIFMSIEEYITKNNLKPSDKTNALYMHSFPDLWPNDSEEQEDVSTQDKNLKMNRNFQMFIDLLHNASKAKISKEKKLVD